MAFMHNRSIGSLYRQYHVWPYRYTSKWASSERQHRVNRASTERQHSINTVSTECQQSVNTFGSCIMYNPRTLLRHRPISNILAAILCKWDRDKVTTPVRKWASKERQQSMNTESTESQQSVNAFGCCVMFIPRALLQHMSIINVLAAVLCKCNRDMVTAPVWKWAPTERQRFCMLHLV